MLPLTPAALIRNVLRILLPVTVALTVYLYLYPVFSGCGFPLPQTAAQIKANYSGGWAPFFETVKLHLPSATAKQSKAEAASDGQGDDGESTGDATPRRATWPRRPIAPFRLLALGDPQLEGDTSIPNAHSDSFPHLVKVVEHLTFRSNQSNLRGRVRQAMHDGVDFLLEDIPNTVESIRKRIDLFGNDFYLAHIYRTLRWWSKPTHVTVLGDLLGSQWLDDAEFEERAARYWDRVVRGGERISDDLTSRPTDPTPAGLLAGDPQTDNDTAAWTRRIINVAGNHDIGYAGDINEERMGRFERLFGKANYQLRFPLPAEALSPEAGAQIYDQFTNPDSDRVAPELRIINLNDMNLDTPAQSSKLQDDTYNFINDVIDTGPSVATRGHFTLLLTHIPFHKAEGICIDSPYFSFHDGDGSLKEQNLLSADASKGLLEGIFGLSGDPSAQGQGKGRRGAILNGHDHEGCDTYHFINQLQGAGPADRAWEAMRWTPARDGGIVGKAGHPGVREITVRSMMGDFGGNAGLLSVWFDEADWEWRFEYATCPLGRQHFWWLVHILDLVAVLAVFVYGALVVLTAVGLDVDRWPGSQSRRLQPAGRASAPQTRLVRKTSGEKPVPISEATTTTPTSPSPPSLKVESSMVGDTDDTRVDLPKS